MKRVARRPVAGLAVVGAIALIAGCGGGDDSDALSADEFRSQADAICTDVEETTDAIPQPTSEDGLFDLLTETRAAQADGLERLNELAPPADLQDPWDEALGLQQEQLDLLDDAIERIEGGESAGAVLDEIGEEAEERSDRLDTLASEIGLTVCGDGEGAVEEGADGASTTLDPVEGDEGDSGDADEPAGATVGVSEYVADAQETAGSLQSFGELLQTVTSADDLETVAPQAQDLLDDFDAGIATMEGYTVDEPQAERQRAVLVSEGPAVSDVLRRFVDAAASGDAAAVQNLLPEVLDALQSFSSAIGATTQP